SAEIKTENSSATETENPTVSEIPNSDPNPVETKTENSSAGETENPTISENPNSDPNSAETKTENSSATETENPTISENPNSEPNPAETKTDSPAVETENPTISENPNSDPNSAETKTENSPAGETENPTISENIISIISENTQPAIAVVNSIDFITGDKIETPVFFQPDKPEISAIPAESTDILTGEIENISPTLIDTPEIASQTPENFPLISPEEISQLWESLNSILAQQFPNIPETESSQNHQPSASEYIVTDAQTIIPEIAVTENHHSQQSENITAGSDNQPPTTIDEYVNPDFDSENIAITPEIPSDANNQPDNSLHIIADSEIATATDSDSETTINEYAITDTKTKLEITPNLPQQNQPLIGIIDTGFTTNNPNINYSQIFLGKDLIEGDNNPLLQPNQANQHGDTILEIISHSNNQSDTKKSTPIWLGRAIGSGNWHQSLIEFVDTAKASKQPNAVVNLSFDLTQINPDGTQTTRYQLTAEEKSALKYAHDNNILIVAAAGNEGDLASALGQASTEFDNIITVGASDNNNRAAYSSYGGGLDILAPTSLTQTAEPSTTETKQGTSIAAAFVTKTISQMWAANPSLNRQQIKNILLKTATDIDVPSWDERTGYGILNRELAIATATETIPTIPVLAAVKQLTKSLIDADANVSNSPNNSTAKPSERATATNAPGTPKTTSTSTGDYNQGTSSYTTELAPYRTTSTSNYNGTNSTNSQTNSNFSNTESSWDKSTVKTNTKGNSFNESISDSSTNAATYTSKNFSQNSVENKNQSQQKYSRVKYEGTRADQSSSNQKSRSSTNYTTPSQTTNTTAESYRNSFSQSDSKYGTGYAMNNGKRQDDWGSKSTSNTRNTSSTGSSLSNSSTQVQGKADWTNSSNGSSSNNTHSGEETTVTKSDSQSSNTSGFSKTNNSGDNYSVINSTWDNSTINGKAVNSNTRDVYSEGNSNSNSSYDDGKSKNTSNRDTYTVNQSQQTNSSNGPAYWQNNRNNNYSVTQGNDTQNYKNGPSTSSHNRDTYSVSKSNSSSSNSSGKVSSKNQQENYSENNAQWESEYKADTYTTQSNSDESTITATKSNSSTEGSNSNSSNSSDTYRTRNSQTVTTYKDGRKTENGGSTYEKWSSESTYDSKGLVSSISKYSTWSSSYSRNYFKGGYSWSETLSGYDSESGTKGGVSTSNGSSWSWTRSGTVWDDGRNNWSESWSKSSWKDGKYAPGESESKRGAFDPKKTTPQVNDVPSFGDAPRLTKAPKKQVPIDLQKPPKPSDDIWTPPRRTVTPPREVENFPDNWVAGPGGGSSPNQDKIQKFLREFRRVMAQGKRAVIDFLKGFIYHSLINGVGLLKDVADLLYPPGAKSHAEIEAYYRNNLSFQLGRAVANGLTFLAGILGILLIGLTIGGSGGSALIAAPAQAAALIVAGNMTAASARDILSLVGQVFQMTSGNSGGSSSIPNPDRTRPSLNPDPNRQPSGSKTIPEPKADELNIRGIARENESAEILSKAGYNVEQNPTVSGTRRPDYKIEGRIFDCYAPITSDPNKIISALKDKIVKGQADRFILNLDDSKVSLADILVHLNRYPAPSIREIIVVRGGTILHFFQ
ncbi:S8 family serine peptidase, partial [Microcoleus sp. AT8-B4]